MMSGVLEYCLRSNAALVEESLRGHFGDGRRFQQSPVWNEYFQQVSEGNWRWFIEEPSREELVGRHLGPKAYRALDLIRRTIEAIETVRMLDVPYEDAPKDSPQWRSGEYMVLRSNLFGTCFYTPVGEYRTDWYELVEITDSTEEAQSIAQSAHLLR